MHIKELEIDNFKSFASDVKIQFLKGFTTVGGPNGSGKSNIIDSILFALGLVNSRSLRTEEVSDFISTYTKKNEAFVKIVFEPDDNTEEPMSVARRLRKSTQGYTSVYYLNDKVSTLVDIHTRLAQYSITPNSYNVIMQSDVMEIVNCSNKERRAIIDDIAGITDFNKKIEKAQNELATVEERVENTNLRLTEISSTVERLEQEKETALKYQKLRNEKTVLESQITTVKYFDIKRNLELAHQNILEFNKKRTKEEGNLKKLEETLDDIKKRYKDISELVKQNGESEQIETKKQLEAEKGKISIKESAISSAEKTIHENLKTIENSKSGIETHKQKIKEYSLEIEKTKKEISDLDKLIQEQDKILKKTLEEVSGLSQNADKQIEERNNLKTELSEIKNQEINIKDEQHPLETELVVAQKDIETAKSELENANNFKKDYKDNKDRLTVQIEELEKELNDYKITQQSVMGKIDTIKNELTDLEYDIRTANNKIITMETQKKASEEANLGRAIDSVLKAKIRGVHAPLLQLGSVDKQYSTALEIAMGGKMKNIVVDDEDVARTCIDFLKSAKAGRATFLPLAKMRKAPSSLKLPKEKGVIDYAINLIDFDDKYLDAFFDALGDTLIVEDFDSAKRLIGKYRIVTLDGSLFAKSGAITGGEKQETGLKFSQNQDEELKKYKSRYNELIEKYETLKVNRKELEDKLDYKIRPNYSNTMTALNSAKLELKNLDDNFGSTEQKITAYSKIIKDNEPKIKNLEKKLDEYEQKLINLHDKELTLQEKIDEIESKMSEGELKKLKELTAGIESKIKDYESKKTNCERTIGDLERNIDFHKNTLITTKEEQIQKLLKDNEIAEADKQKFADEIKEIQITVDKLEEKIKTLGEKLKQLQQQRDSVQQELLNAENDRNKIQNEIEKIGEQVEAFKARRRELEPQLEEVTTELKNNEIDINSLVPTELSTEEITSKIQRLQKRMDEMGDVNMRAIQTYDEVKARNDALKGQIETLTKERKEILEKMSGFEQQKKETFMTTFNNINENFKEVFAKLSEGEGSLLLENPESPFEGGLTIRAQIRDKNQQKLVSLSGGEKSITALAFVFAIQKYMPAPFYALDEVDASLDGINEDKMVNMIKEQAKNTQFIVVSHKQNVLKSGDRMIGVTQKEKGKTQISGIIPV